MNAVKHGEMGVNEADKVHGIPTTTLKDRISSRITYGNKPGHKQYLNKEEEKELLVFLKQSAAIGYAETRREVVCIAQSVAKEKDVLRKDKITHEWWKKTVERQCENIFISNIRMDATNKMTYWKLL